MESNGIRVLVACEESQAVCIEFRKRGFEAFSCDILPCSGGHPEWHIQGDVLEQLDKGWDAILAFPPCTHLAVSGAAWFKNKREDGSQEDAIRFFMEMYNAPCDYVCVENPVGIISGKYILKHFPTLCEELGLPIKQTQIIEPYYFGDEANKKTCLWLKGLPPLAHDPANYSKGSTYYTSPSGNRSPDWHQKTGGGSGKVRSKTYPGIARAMAEQWGDFLIRQKFDFLY